MKEESKAHAHTRIDKYSYTFLYDTAYKISDIITLCILP